MSAPYSKATPGGLEGVVLAWTKGRKLRSGNIKTDGESLFSWHLCIGKTVAGRKVAIDYRGRVSGSTTRHCAWAISRADETEGHPEADKDDLT